MTDRFEIFTACISELYWMIQKIEREEMEAYGLKGPHAQCLIAMNAHPQGITAAELSALCERDKAAISRTVAELVQQGLVKRDGHGTYRALLRLTDVGTEMAHQVRQKVDLAVERAGLGLSDDDRAVFYSCLRRISSNIKQISEEGLG